jgi:hydrogenase maturation protein HypF
LLESALRAPRAAQQCTSAGRLFDAWAALLGIGDRAAFEAEPALRLEDQAEPGHHDTFPIAIAESSETPGPRWRVDWRPWVEETLAALDRGVPAPRLAARFQNSLAQSCVEIARRVGIETVALGGGCFQNARLTETLVELLKRDGFRPLIPRRLPAGDGGLAVGQLWAAVLGLAGAKLGDLREMCGGSDKTSENSEKTSRRNFGARG